MLASAKESWLAERMKRSLQMDSETPEGTCDLLVENRTREDIAHEMQDVVNLSAGGQVARPPSPVVIEAVRKALDDWHTAHYPGVMGYRDYRVACAEKLARENGIQADPDSEITPILGNQEAIDGAIRILVNPGDEVLLITPEYAAIEPLIHMAGGEVVHVPLVEGKTEWSFDPDALRKRITKKTKLFMLVNGHNPVGILYSRQELEAIAALAQEHNFFVFSDEEYEKLVFDGLKHTSIASLPGMHDRTITAFSFSKTYSMSGFRIGYMVANPAITDEMYNIIRLQAQAVSSYGMLAATAVLRSDMTAWLADTVRELTEKRDYAVKRLNAMPGVTCGIPRGCYFLLPNFSSYGVPSWRMARHFLEKGRVAVVAGNMFGPAGAYHLRISGCVGLDAIKEGLDRMEEVLPALHQA
jgi:aspartate/methionine/tyrosine aminotransferase